MGLYTQEEFFFFLASLLEKTAVQQEILHASHILKSGDMKLLLSACLSKLMLQVSENCLRTAKVS